MVNLSLRKDGYLPVGAQIVLGAVVLVFDIPLSSNVESAAELDADRAYLVATLATAVIAAVVASVPSRTV